MLPYPLFRHYCSSIQIVYKRGKVFYWCFMLRSPPQCLQHNQLHRLIFEISQLIEFSSCFHQMSLRGQHVGPSLICYGRALVTYETLWGCMEREYSFLAFTKNVLFFHALCFSASHLISSFIIHSGTTTKVCRKIH